jgi:cobalt-zinc-cadmium efflux system outer membrane protein
MRSWLFAALLFVGCVPSREALFDPVRAAVEQRTGIAPDWRGGRTPEVRRRVGALLAQPLTADSAAIIAVLNSPALQAEYEELGKSGARYRAARTLPNPEVDLELRFPTHAVHPTEFELAALQGLTGLLAMLPRARATDAELRATRRRAAALTIELWAKARLTFYRAAAAEQRLGLRKTIAEAAAAALALARALHESGGITDVDLLRERLFDENARLAVLRAEADRASAREQVNAVLGLHGDETAWTLAARLPDPPDAPPEVGNLEREAVESSLDLDALRWRLEAAGARVGVARIESFPNVSAGVSAIHEAEWRIGPALRIALPLFDWGQGKRALAWARVYKLQGRYAAFALQLRAAARAAQARIAAAHTRVIRMEKQVLPLREQLAEQSLRQYNAMNLSPFELLMVRREAVEAEEEFADALRDYWMARVEVEQLRAGAMPGGASAGAAGDEGETRGPGEE